MIKVAIIGSTGSIGKQALDVIRSHPDTFEVAALTANTDAEALYAQAKEFKPPFIALGDLAAYKDFPSIRGVRSDAGADALIAAVTETDADIVLISVVGMCALPIVLAAIEAGKTVALANKEALVAGGNLVMSAAKRKKVNILPVDSEHSAVFQCLTDQKQLPQRIILTASGGAFYKLNLNELEQVTPEMAVMHPNWSMGKKISVDSATMMNKALEIIEARFLFDIESIDYVIHPQSVVHSMIEFCDGSIIAQASFPDMRLPIQYALGFPKRLNCVIPKIKLPLSLEFLPPREDIFIAPALARKALDLGGTAPCVLNAANEAAVHLFLKNKIRFTDITQIVEKTLLTFTNIAEPTAEDITDTYNNITEALVKRYS